MHRPSYLDYVGVKKFDADGNVVGERRFLGLFSSAAYTESVRRVPGASAARSHEVLERRRVLARQPRRQGPAADPGDLPARRALPDPGRRPAADRHSACCTCQERRQLRLFLRQDDYGRYYLRAWSTCRATATPPRSGCGCRRSCMEELGGTSVDYTAWITESVLARLHFVVRVEPRHRAAATLDRRRHGAHRGAARRGHPLLGRRLRRGAERRAAARSAPPSCCAATPTPSPRATRTTTRRAPPSPTCATWRRSAEPRQGLRALPVRAGRRRPRRAPLQDLPHRRAVSLSAVLPVLQRLGVEVVDERPYELRCADRTHRVDLRLRAALPGRRRRRLPGDDARELLPGRLRRRLDAARPRATASTRSCCAPG